MTDASARWRRVEALCQAALERDARDRADFLTAACGDDDDLRREVDALLAHEGSAEGFLGSPLGAIAANVLNDRAASLVGRRVGVYEIVSPLGAGGMGEVYRARDTLLGREVAIKVLPPAFVADRERLARFEREARVLAALNHPHVGAIYGVEPFEGARALILELVEGETLEQQLGQGGLPITAALVIARQIADALESAHEKGIVHRDLKPSNIKIAPDGIVKVLDFGLAKGGDAHAHDASRSPTMTMGGTGAGMVLGTAAYMSPEQARGQAVDRRSDIWAFGCVLYEMVTGFRAFTGDDVTDTIVAIVSKEPDWQLLPATASGVRPLLARCLKKDLKQRLQAIGDARIQVEELISDTSEDLAAARAPAATPSRRAVPAVIAGLVGAAAVGALAMWATTRPAPPGRVQPSRFEIVPPPAQALAVQGADRDIAISPDGQYIVYRADAGRGQLVLRAIDRLEVHTVARVADARDPFFSPDRQWIGFFDGAGLKKAPIAGGSPIMIWKGAIVPRGASWGDDNSIVFAARDIVGLRRVSASGGEPTALTTPDATKNETSHWYPSVLPGGRGVLFTVTAPNRMESAQVAVLDLKTGQSKTLIRGGSQAEYVSSGHLLFAAAGTLRAVRFDLEQLEVLSDPVPVVEDIWMAGDGAANYAISRTGTLVYVPESGARRPRSLVWADRTGHETPIAAPPRMYSQPRLSPDGTRVAIAIRDQEQDIWIWDLARETGLTRLTFDPGLDQSPVWTPDGRRIVFASQRGGASNLFMQAADGTGVVERLTTSADDQTPAWVAPDGTGVVGWVVTPKAKGDIVWFPRERPASRAGSNAASAAGVPSVEPLVSTPAMEFNPEISPDGRHMAYQSNESGRLEIYVRPFPHVNDGRWQVSTGGGTKPAWARNGRELFYLDQANTLTVVPVQTAGATFAMGNPATLFEATYAGTLTSLRDYDVAPDGRFLMIKENVARDRNATPGMVVVENWFEELKAKIAVGK